MRVLEWLEKWTPPPFPQVPFTFAIGGKGRDEWTYRDDRWYLTIYAEMLSGNPSRLIGADSLQSANPEIDNTLPDAEEQRRVLANISAYCERNRITFRIE